MPRCPGTWRRYLTLILDGVRPGREGGTPLPVAALRPEEPVAALWPEEPVAALRPEEMETSMRQAAPRHR
jgi:hypothetical protein